MKLKGCLITLLGCMFCQQSMYKVNLQSYSAIVLSMTKKIEQIESDCGLELGVLEMAAKLCVKSA